MAKMTAEAPKNQTPPESHSPEGPQHNAELRLSGRHERIGSILDNPKNFISWMQALDNPENFANIDKIEGDIRDNPEKYLTLKESLKATGGNLNYAILHLLIPQLSEDQIKRTTDSQAFKKLRPLLLLFLYRFPTRINGLVYLLEQACKQTCKPAGQRVNMVGTKKYTGSVIRIDMKEFTTHTYHQGEAATVQLMQTNFYPPFFEVLRHYPNVKFIDTIGDEIVCIIEEPQNDEDIRFAQDLAAKFTLDTHIGIGQGEYEVTITPYGKVVVGGKASDSALDAQKGNTPKDKKVHIKTSSGSIEHHDKAPKEKELPSAPDNSAIHLFKGISAEEIETILSDPEELYRAVKEQMAMTACPITKTALKLENPIELKATTICITAPVQKGDEVIIWEAQLEELAEKYDGTVLHLEISGGKKKGIIIFGALESSPFDKEERIAGCTNQVITNITDCKIGIATGPMLVSDTSKEGTISDSVNRAARLAHADDSRRVIPKRKDDQGMGQIKMDAKTYENLQKAGIIPKGDFTRLDLQIKGTGRQPTITCNALETQTEEAKYTRQSEVKRLVETIKQALHNGNPETKLHFNLSGSEGMGQREILKAATKELRESGDDRIKVIELTGPRLASRRQKHRTYTGLEELITQKLFPHEEDLRVFMNQQAIEADSPQGVKWLSIYRELQGQRTSTNILSNTTTARAEIIGMLRALGNIGICCESIDRMDDTSEEILQESGIILITTGYPSATYDLEIKGVDLKEALAIIAHRLETDSVPEDLATLIHKQIPTDQDVLFNPMLVEALADDLIEVEAIRKGDPNYYNPATTQDLKASRSVRELQQGMVRTKIEKITEIDASAILRTAILLGDCTKHELETAIGYAIREESLVQLVEIGILLKTEDPDKIRFAASFPVEVASDMHSLATEESDKMEQRLRKAIETSGQFSLGKYLDVCKSINMHLATETIRIIATQAPIMLAQGGKIEAMDTCAQFIDTNHHAIINPAFARELTPETANHILQIHYALIEAKISIGRSVTRDLARLRDFHSALAGTVEYNLENLTGESTKYLIEMPPTARGKYFLLACKSAYRGKDDETLRRILPMLETAYPEDMRDASTRAEIGLLESQLHYRLADKQKQSDAVQEVKNATRREELEKALSALEKIDISAIGGTPLERTVKCFAFQVRGYSLLEAGISSGPEAIPSYIAELSAYLTLHEDEYGEDETLLEAEQYLARAEIGKILGVMMPQIGQEQSITAVLEDFNPASERIRKNLETSRNNGYVKTTLKSLNYLMNIIYFRNLLQIKKYDPAVALDSLTEEGGTAYQESLQIQQGLTEEDEAGVSIDIAANQLTRLEMINLQLTILSEHRSLRPGAEISILERGEETITTMREYTEKFPQVKPVWWSYMEPEIQNFNRLKASFTTI